MVPTFWPEMASIVDAWNSFYNNMEVKTRHKNNTERSVVGLL